MPQQGDDLDQRIDVAQYTVVSSDMHSAPLVSIVLATYNRSTILAHAIESVRRSSIDDWELIVVGDCCTDDTAEVVARFADRRITFVNLTMNVGEQSGPNNEGVRSARGQYLAFLNHDDMYFPDHLREAVRHIDHAQADFVWSSLITALPVSAEDLAAGRWNMRLWGVTKTDDYDPRTFVFASAWLMRRELADRIGPWRHAHEVFVTPSQDWIFRAWRSGARMRRMPLPSVIAVPGGARAGSYTSPASEEHRFYAARLHEDPRLFRERALAIAAVEGEREARQYRLGRDMRSLVARPIAAVSQRLGWHPYAPLYALRHGRRGNLVNAARHRTGLGKLSRRQR
jgi:glycosyltransferase involved in cell wall biosynthesis